MRHSITNPNADLRVGDCAVCGPEKLIVPSYSKRPNDPKWKCRVVRDRNDKHNSNYEHPLARDREALLEKHGPLCDICGEGATGLGHEGRLHYDHNPRNKKHRGWLCGNCNKGLGQFHDNPITLLAAAEYLQRAEDIADRN